MFCKKVQYLLKGSILIKIYRNCVFRKIAQKKRVCTFKVCLQKQERLMLMNLKFPSEINTRTIRPV